MSRYKFDHSFYSNLNCAPENLKIERVNQADHLPDGHQGICCGLSTLQIITQLNAGSKQFINPLNDKNLIMDSQQLHNDKDLVSRCYVNFDKKPSTSLKDTKTVENDAARCTMYFDKRRALIQQKTNISLKDTKTAATEFDSVDALAEHLKQKITKSTHDGKNRAAYVSFNINRHPVVGNRLNDSPSHVMSMTIQPDKSGVTCVGFESNLFFAVAEDKGGCYLLTEKIRHTLEAYDATHCQTEFFTSRK